MKLFDHTVMAHSDTEEVYETTDTGLKQLNLTDALGDTETYEKTIHSGHFMISHVHDDSISEQDKDLDDELVPKEESTDYPYDSGRVSTIDPSFTQLFQCMSIVEKYFSTSGKLTSPKWKNFKGIKFRLKEKIRVNNLIWREWHMQYVKCLPPILCHFSSPLAVQSDGNSSVDGMYWKRNLKVLTNDYKKWRHYFNKKLVGSNNVRDVLSSNSPYCEILQRTSENNSKRLTNLGGIVKKPHYQNPPSQLLMDEDIFMDFSDTLFMSGLLIDGSNLKEIPAFSDENFNEMMQDGCLNDMDTLDTNIFRCESLNFNKAYSTPSVQSSTMLNNAHVQEQSVCNTNQPNMENLNLLNVDNALINLPMDIPTSGNMEKSMGFQTSELMSLLVSQQSLNEPNAINNVNVSYQELPVQIESRPELKHDFVIDNLFNSSAAAPSFNIEVQPSSNIILSNQEALSENVVGVLYAPNNDFQVNQGSQSMPLLSGLLQQQKPPMIILPPGYRIVTSQDINQENAAIENTNLTNFGQNFGNLHVQVQSKVKSPPSQIGSQSLGCLQVIPNTKENRCKNNLSTGSLTSRASVGFRIPQQQSKCRQKTSNIVNIQPRPQTFSISTMQPSAIKRLLLPTTSPSRVQSSTSCASNHFNQLNSQENGPKCYSVVNGSNFTTKSEKRRRIRNERDPSHVSLVAKKNEKMKNDSFSAIFQPINPLVNSSVQPQPSNIAPYNLHSLYGATETQIDQGTSKYNLESTLGFNDTSHIFKVPDRSRHASNDSGSSHCEDSFTFRAKKFVNKDLRRVSHLTSEQKRRFSIKCGLDTLNGMVPGLDSSSGSRISKATTLHKAAEFCKKLKADKQMLLEEIDRVKNEVYSNELAIKNAHSQMPVQGLPSSGSRSQANQMKAWFQKFILQRSHDNWKYWIDVVITSGVEQFRQSILRWLTDHCSLIILRPIVSNSLRKLSTSTCILVNPDGFQKQVVCKINSAVTKNSLQL